MAQQYLSLFLFVRATARELSMRDLMRAQQRERETTLAKRMAFLVLFFLFCCEQSARLLCPVADRCCVFARAGIPSLVQFLAGMAGQNLVALSTDLDIFRCEARLRSLTHSINACAAASVC